jgi:hypothetical protein
MEREEIERIVTAALTTLYEQNLAILRLDVAARTNLPAAGGYASAVL